ncbi:MAG: tetratricopeptide repeat protein [Myxococcota bacterium]
MVSLLFLTLISQPVDVDRAKADELASSLSVAKLEEAVSIYERLLKDSPGNFDLLLRAATGLNDIMSLKTQQNLPYIDDGDLELSDTSANKKIWRRYGERAVDYAKQALDKKPQSREAALAYANSYMYVSSSMGIVSAILDGAAGTYKDNAQRLVDISPGYEDGVGYFFFAAFYLVAPWPMYDFDDSREYLTKALRSSPKSLRNHYLLGVLEFVEDNWDESEAAFNTVLAGSCRNRGERQICAFIKKQARSALAEIANAR